MTPVYLVIDIGKTNKKILVYDKNLKIQFIRKTQIGTYLHDELDVEDVAAIERWLISQLAELSRIYHITGISISTHGAMAVCVGDDGLPCVPPLAYTNEITKEIRDDFYNTMGTVGALQEETATAEIKPLVNVGKLLWYAKQLYPREFERIVHVLFYPQYFGFRLTGRVAADITSIGAHTYLWNFKLANWSDMVGKLGLIDKLPQHPLVPFESIGTISTVVSELTGLPTDTPVTAGVHDSNASLIPYLIKKGNGFVLNSTGTWCVAMHPQEEITFTEEERGNLVYYNLSYRSQPVKTSIVMAGLEYETWLEIIQTHHDRDDRPQFDLETYRSITEENSRFLYPSVMPGTGQFPDSISRIVEKRDVITLDEIQSGNQIPDFFSDYNLSLAVLNLSVAIQSQVAIQRVGILPGEEIFTEGGFCRNEHYNILIRSLFPNNPVFTTSLDEATGFGAALCCKAMVEYCSPEDLAHYVVLDRNEIDHVEIPGLNSYVDKWNTGLNGS